LISTTLIPKGKPKSLTTCNKANGNELTKKLVIVSHYVQTATEYYTGMRGWKKMLTKEQLENWEHFKIADKICERARRGLPQDRWMRGNHEMYAMVKAYMDLTSMMQNMHNDMIQKGLDAMDIE
jgi:hypothetical protein